MSIVIDRYILRQTRSNVTALMNSVLHLHNTQSTPFNIHLMEDINLVQTVGNVV